MNKSTKKSTPKVDELQSLKDYCDKYFPSRKRCPHPNCPENDRPEFPFEKCTLHEPIWISIPAGEHIHISCPVHPNGHILRGPDIHFGKPKVTWGPDDFYKLRERFERPNLPEPDNNLPDYSKIGKVWM